MQRKICPVGNSQGVLIPKEALEKLHLHVGSQVEVRVDERQKKIIIEPRAKRPLEEAIDKKFADEVSDFIGRYRPALKALARK